MVRHSRLRSEDSQPVPVAEAGLKKVYKHREPDASRKQNKSLQDVGTSRHNAFKSTAKRTTEKRKYSDRSIASVSGIFKSLQKGGRQDKKSRRKDKTPELIVALEDGLDEARYAISEKTHSTFEEVHNRLSQRISSLEKDDNIFFNAVSQKATLLSAPLVEEKIDTMVRQSDGSQKRDVVHIGDRVAAFKAVIDTEDEKLKKLWKQWDGLQEEYIKLGVEVFGQSKFGESAAAYKDLDGGYRKDMQIWELEHETLVEEIEDEIENTGVKILYKLKSTEKSLDTTAKKGQARLLQSIME